jgi:hypothetical protein
MDYIINVAEKTKDGRWPSYRHYCRIELPAVGESHAREIFEDIVGRFPGFVCTLSAWQNTGHDLERRGE